MRLAIVIPTLNEEAALAACLERARNEADEVVVSDGGSSDRTRELATQHGARVVTGAAGRGGQLIRGVAATTTDAVLVLHADTELPVGAGAAVRRALADGAVGGGFAMRFDDHRRLLRLATCLINHRTRWSKTPLGDQAQFFTRAAYERIGGFRDWPLLEDLDFMRRLGTAGRRVVLTPPVVTAARRYVARGVLRNVATNWLLWSLFWLGVSPHRLARLYRAIR
jgi:rSAM/selenodomain-associated transferase 2